MSTDQPIPEEHFLNGYMAGRSEFGPGMPRESEMREDWNAFLARVRRDAYDWGRHDERMSLAYAPPATEGGPSYPEGETP